MAETPQLNEREEGTQLALDWSKLRQIAASSPDVLPVVVQEASTGQILILAYANAQALDESRQRGIAVFWSTSRNELWIKGATSGDTLRLLDIRVNCEQNSLLYLVEKNGRGACHTHDSEGIPRPTCYYRRISPDGSLALLPERATIP